MATKKDIEAWQKGNMSTQLGMAAFRTQRRADAVADIRNKLGPFWALIDIMLIDDGDLPEDEDAYARLMQDTTFKCRENQDLITAKLNELL